MTSGANGSGGRSTWSSVRRSAGGLIRHKPASGRPRALVLEALKHVEAVFDDKNPRHALSVRLAGQREKLVHDFVSRRKAGRLGTQSSDSLRVKLLAAKRIEALAEQILDASLKAADRNTVDVDLNMSKLFVAANELPQERPAPPLVDA